MTLRDNCIVASEASHLLSNLQNVSYKGSLRSPEKNKKWKNEQKGIWTHYLWIDKSLKCAVRSEIINIQGNKQYINYNKQIKAYLSYPEKYTKHRKFIFLICFFFSNFFTPHQKIQDLNQYQMIFITITLLVTSLFILLT